MGTQTSHSIGLREKNFFFSKVGFLRFFSPDMKDNLEFGWMVMPLTRMQLQVKGQVYCRGKLNHNQIEGSGTQEN